VNSILKAVVGLAAASALAAADALVREPAMLVLETVEVPICGLPDGFNGYRIALLADFHYPRWIDEEGVERALALALDFQPDLMVIAGDITDRTADRRTPKLKGVFDMARAPDGVVGVLGNHDHWVDAHAVRRQLDRHTPIELIENRGFCVTRGGRALAIGGVGDLWLGVCAPRRALRGVPPEVPRILVSHNPDIAESTRPGLRIDLQLSGHTHGGQVRIPFGPAPRMPSRYGNKFRAGLVAGRSHRVYITRGVCSSHHLRFWCPPEVTGIILRPWPVRSKY
jgi:predicted MPP superfamily phosphohydrolase